MGADREAAAVQDKFQDAFGRNSGMRSGYIPGMVEHWELEH